MKQVRYKEGGIMVTRKTGTIKINQNILNQDHRIPPEQKEKKVKCIIIYDPRHDPYPRNPPGNALVDFTLYPGQHGRTTTFVKNNIARTYRVTTPPENITY